jgi:hypothetical protein
VSLRDEMVEHLREVYDLQLRSAGRALFRLGQLSINIRATGGVPESERYWFDVTPSLFDEVNLFVFVCRGVDSFYVIPAANLKEMVADAPGRGVKKVPNFNIDKQRHKLIPVGTASKEGFDVTRYFKNVDKLRPTPGPAPRQPIEVNRIIRDTEITLCVKRWHNFCCQVCGGRLETPDGPYSEGAHIIPLGKPHDGQDDSDNVLCLCPNHHVLFDRLAFAVADNLDLLDPRGVLGLKGVLRTVTDHDLNPVSLAHHRSRCGF